MRTATFTLVFVLAALVSGSGTVHAQTIGGQLKESRAGQPLRSFPVRLMRISPDTVDVCDSMLTDERGLFQLVGRGAGHYELVLGQPGTRLANSIPLDATKSDTSIFKAYVIPLLDLADQRPFAPTDVQQQANPNRAIVLRYPEALLSRRVFGHGEVRVRFVVDASGHVPRPLITIVSASRQEFADAVVETLAKLMFEPARIGGVAVPQWVELPLLTFDAIPGT